MTGPPSYNVGSKLNSKGVRRLRKQQKRSKTGSKDKHPHGGNHIQSKKKERAIQTQLRHELRTQGLSKEEIEQVIPDKKKLRQAKAEQRRLALTASTQPVLEQENAMDIAEAAEGVGITLGAPTVFLY
eukprot:m.78363 g.78363  ORF g.78363 m.78363 type:complete len:128 (-) comp14105_c1_seq1:2512-2895(-)